MKNFKYNTFIIYFSLFFLLIGFSNAVVYNQGGTFTASTDSLNNLIYNDNINTNFKINIKNEDSISRNFSLNIQNVSGWNISYGESRFILNSGESRDITLYLSANSNFVYSENVVGTNEIKISRKSDYSGNFDFPVIISNSIENLSVNFKVEIQRSVLKQMNFAVKFSKDMVSPQIPLKFAITGSDLPRATKINVKAVLNGLEISNFEEQFSDINNYKIFNAKIPNNILPGEYDLALTIRSAGLNSSPLLEWNFNSKIIVKAFDNVVVVKNVKDSFFRNSVQLEVSNSGNINSSFTHKVNLNSLDFLLFSSNLDYLSTKNEVEFSIPLKQGESIILNYEINYIIIYVLLVIIIFIFGYIYIRKHSNPIDIETKIYNVRSDKYEGVKSLKVQIGFENIRQSEISELKVVFGMPSYLNVKDGSFLLSEPNHVLKGKNLFKLTWNFKKFTKQDSRILGFTLVNAKGILGDIRLPQVEIKVKIGNVSKKYTKSFPVIRG